MLCVVTLEELGATGNKGLIGLMTNPVLANGLAGLATSATAQATVEVGPLLPETEITEVFLPSYFDLNMHPLCKTCAGDIQKF